MENIEQIIRNHLAPGNVFKRIQRCISETRNEIHIDGSSDYQRGFIEGLDLALHVISSEEGNLVCEVTAFRHRLLRQEAKS